MPQFISPANWPEFRRDDQRTGNNPLQTTITKANVGTLKIKWTQTIHGMRATPVIVNGMVYAADYAGYIHAFNESNGAPLWTFLGTYASTFTATPLYVGGVLYVGNRGLYPLSGGEFFAINATTGVRVWHYQSPVNFESFRASPVMWNGLVWQGQSTLAEFNGLCLTGQQLIAFDHPTGTIVRQLTTSAPGTSGEDVWASPMIGLDGYVYAGTGNLCTPNTTAAFPNANALLKVNPLNASLMWTAGAQLLSIFDYDYGATPLYVNGMVVDAPKTGILYAISAATGTPLWQVKVGSLYDGVFASPATDGSAIYVGVNQSTINPFGVCQPYAPACGSVTAVSMLGSVLWSTPMPADKNGDSVLSDLAVSQGMVFVASGGGIYALDAASGAILWKYQTSHLVYGGAAIVNGGLFIGEYDGPTLYCFTPNGQ